jgi:hypothetical protein
VAAKSVELPLHSLKKLGRALIRIGSNPFKWNTETITSKETLNHPIILCFFVDHVSSTRSSSGEFLFVSNLKSS